jgi:hypothetical protein
MDPSSDGTQNGVLSDDVTWLVIGSAYLGGTLALALHWLGDGDERGRGGVTRRRARSRFRQTDGYLHPPGHERLRFESAMVGVDHRGDDREPEPGPLAVGQAALEAHERLEERRHRRLWHVRTGVGDRHGRGTVVGATTFTEPPVTL